MGRIKSLMIKKAAKQLLDGENQFNTEFNHNKRVLGSTMPSKPIRNKIAGYIARIVRMKKDAKLKEQKAALKAVEVIEPTSSY